jgi:hypothetical protein
MCHGNSVTGRGLVRHPAPDASDELYERLPAMRSSFHVCKPRRESVRIARMNLVDFFASPRSVIDVREFSRYRRLKAQGFRRLLRALLGAA